jgi:flagellar motor switch protein FliN
MTEKLHYLDCWISVASSLFSQALAGEPVLSDSLPKPITGGAFGFAAMIEGDVEGRFAVLLDGALESATLLGDGVDQKSGWAELLKEVADAAAGELLAKSGRKCHVKSYEPIESESKLSRAFQLKAGDRSWWIQVHSEVRVPKATAPVKAVEESPPVPGRATSAATSRAADFSPASPSPALSAGLELLLDVELEASLRFGAREMPLGEILDLGPGDVVQLDRHVHDPVDLIVGDKIIARGEVVLVNGNFGLRVTEVAEPQRRLENIRCLF